MGGLICCQISSFKEAITDNNHGLGRPQHREEGGEYTRQKLQSVRVDVQQKA